MLTIALASQKGGAGKTTLAGHLAVEAELSNAGPVALVDADPQGSLAEWWNARASDTPVFAHTSLSRLRDDVARMRDRGIRLLVIDTPPAITATIGEVISISDLVVVPVRPSPHDIRSVVRTVDLVEQYDKPLVFVINGAHPTALITNQAVIALSQHGTLAPSIIHQRTDFASSMIDGRTAMEMPRKSRSANEIALLWDYLRKRLERGLKQPISLPFDGADPDPEVPVHRFG
ncbi:MAG: ParA family protein [Alphaproteobacteria bacterium]